MTEIKTTLEARLPSLALQHFNDPSKAGEYQDLHRSICLGLLAQTSRDRRMIFKNSGWVKHLGLAKTCSSCQEVHQLPLYLEAWESGCFKGKSEFSEDDLRHNHYKCRKFDSKEAYEVATKKAQIKTELREKKAGEPGKPAVGDKDEQDEIDLSTVPLRSVFEWDLFSFPRSDTWDPLWRCTKCDKIQYAVGDDDLCDEGAARWDSTDCGGNFKQCKEQGCLNLICDPKDDFSNCGARCTGTSAYMVHDECGRCSECCTVCAKICGGCRRLWTSMDHRDYNGKPCSRDECSICRANESCCGMCCNCCRF